MTVHVSGTGDSRDCGRCPHLGSWINRLAGQKPHTAKRICFGSRGSLVQPSRPDTIKQALTCLFLFLWMPPKCTTCYASAVSRKVVSWSPRQPLAPARRVRLGAGRAPVTAAARLNAQTLLDAALANSQRRDMPKHTTVIIYIEITTYESGV